MNRNIDARQAGQCAGTSTAGRLRLWLLLTALLLPLAAPAQQVDQTGSYVDLSAGAEREVPNDEFVALAAVERSDRSSAATQVAVNQVLASVAKSVRTAGLEFETGEYDTSRVEDPVKPGFTGVPPAHWVTRATVRIKSQDLEALSRYLGNASADFAVERIASGLRHETRSQLTGTLRGEAIAAFLAKAGEAARGFGHPAFEIARVSVEDGGGPVRPYPAPMLAQARVALAAPPPLTITEGRTLVQVTVSGSIRLLPTK